ncbi:MAG: CRP-like cAMP-binding protein [Arenicella sp.]|jgi:CRP-like cAMP-binding protein
MNPIHILSNQIDELNLWESKISLKRNDFLKLGGSTDTKLYYVLNGSLRMFVMDKSEELTIRFGYKDSFVASLDSFISEKESDLYIQAIKKTELKVISKKRFIEFVESTPENHKIWIEILSQLIQQQMERERDILTTSPVERYKRVLARSPQLFQEIPLKHIASYLRMTPETLSRIKK